MEEAVRFPLVLIATGDTGRYRANLVVVRLSHALMFLALADTA